MVAVDVSPFAQEPENMNKMMTDEIDEQLKSIRLVLSWIMI